MAVYIVRHGEVEHHRSDVELTARGREQARAAGIELASRMAGNGTTVRVFYSPVLRVLETAQLLTETLGATLAQTERARAVIIHAPQPDGALENARFILDAQRGMQEPSLLYADINTPEFMRTISPARAEFYRGFWASDDPMGYWLTHDSDGGAEAPAAVLRRLEQRLRDIFSADGADTVFVLVTHSGAMRVLLSSAYGTDPGEPDFCAIISVTPTHQPGQVRFTYRDRGVDYALF